LARSSDSIEEHAVIAYFSQGWLLKIEEYFLLNSDESLCMVFQ